jgi:hypothetical protein
MRGSTGFAAADYHLVERTPVRELRVQLLAKFARPAGPCVKAVRDGEVNVFHEKMLLGGLDGFARFCEPES